MLWPLAAIVTLTLLVEFAQSLVGGGAVPDILANVVGGAAGAAVGLVYTTFKDAVKDGTPGR